MQVDGPPPLRFAERRIATLDKCYCVAPYVSSTEPDAAMFLVAAEQDSPCFLCRADGRVVEKLWESPGGVMSMVQLREAEGRMVLATQQFYGPDNSEHAKLVVARALKPAPAPEQEQGGGAAAAGSHPEPPCTWRRFVVAEMPFVHRFDVVPGRGRGNADRYLVACTLKRNQQCAGDWSQPGQVLAAKLPADFSALLPEGWHDAADGTGLRHPLDWKVLRDGMLKNHGYSRHYDAARQEVNCVVGCDSGAFLFRPPGEGSEEWEVTQLTTDPTSDAVLVDLDGDGEEELLALSPFHGDTVVIYHRNAAQAFERVYTHPSPLPFLHAIWAGQLGGRSCAVVGHRAGARDLYVFTHTAALGYHAEVVARDCGPANAMKVTYTDSATGSVRECIVSCNRETDAVTAYDVV